MSLYGNEIRGDAAVSLAFSLSEKTKLNCLSLNGNEFGPAGIRNVIQALDSVGLLPAIEMSVTSKTEQEEDDEDADGVDVYQRAFDEDIGSDDENEGSGGGEEDYELEYEEYDDDQDYDDEEEDDEEDEQENSFDTVKNNFARPGRASGASLHYVPNFIL